MKKPRKPPETRPIIFFRAGWCIGYHNRCKPRTDAHRSLFRMYLWRLPHPPPADIQNQLETTIAEMKGVM